MARSGLCSLGVMAVFAGLPEAVPAQRTSPGGRVPPTCTPDLLPAAEKAAIEKEYSRRTRTEGKARADAWMKGAARAFVSRLVAEGVCTPPRNNAQAATPPRPATRKDPAGKDGKPCKHTRMENRAVANVGGGPMMMVLVPVCAD